MVDYPAALLRRMTQHPSLQRPPGLPYSADDAAIDTAIKLARGSNASIVQPDGTVSSSSVWLQNLENQMVSGVAGTYSGLSWQSCWGT